MAKKKSARTATPSFFLEAPSPPPLPGSRPLFLPALVREAAGEVNKYLPRECALAHAAFTKWIDDLEAGVLDAQTETQVEQDFYKASSEASATPPAPTSRPAGTGPSKPNGRKSARTRPMRPWDGSTSATTAR
jgi:hypothetical protein